MSTSAQHVSGLRSAPQATFGAVLLVGWLIESFFWVYATIHSVADGQITPLITAVAALALLVLLFGMEGLEVAVIDRWRTMYPERTTSDLAAWLAARQLFVALIVTTATILAHRDAIIIPGSGSEVTSGLVLGIYDLTWTGFAVLWFAQIFPKHLAATNPDRYLHHLRDLLFPIVEVVRRIGVSKPGEWVASSVERRLDWHAEPALEEGPPVPGESLAEIWSQLIPESAPPPARERPAGSPAPTGSSGRGG
jgi:Mg2+/Co2+ transporter CorB